MWLEADPGYADIRSRVQALAASAGLPASGWSLRDDGWQIVECRARTDDYATIDSALAWFMERFGELESAGLFALHRELADTGETRGVSLRKGRPATRSSSPAGPDHDPPARGRMRGSGSRSSQPEAPRRP